MAFPTVAARNSSTSASGTSHVVALPAGIVAGNRLVVAFVCSNAPTVTWPAGWATNIYSGNDASSTSRIEVHERIADGTEGASITITTSTNQTGSHRSWRITDSDTATASEGAGASGWSNAPNPPNLDPAGWGAEDTLWLALTCFNTQPAELTGYPASYTDTAAIGVPAVASSLGVGERQLNAAAENPGAFALSGNYNWRAVTVAIRPASGATLLVQDASHAHAADSLTLTQVHSLSVADALHAHAADSPALTQVHLLVLQDALHAHTADGLLLTETHQLVIQEASHSHVADSLVLESVVVALPKPEAIASVELLFRASADIAWPFEAAASVEVGPLAVACVTDIFEASATVRRLVSAASQVD